MPLLNSDKVKLSIIFNFSILYQLKYSLEMKRFKYAPIENL